MATTLTPYQSPKELINIVSSANVGGYDGADPAALSAILDQRIKSTISQFSDNHASNIATFNKYLNPVKQEAVESPTVTPVPVAKKAVQANPPVSAVPDMASELKKFGNTPMKYDAGDTPVNMANVVAKKMGLNPSLFLSSAWQEGMNKAALHPEDVSEYYNKAKVSSDFPVDGFLNYGLDTIGNQWNKVKKYLPDGFEENVKFYDAVNEKGEKVKTAAFNYNENALMAKAAMMKMERDSVAAYAKEKNIPLDDKALDYFMLAGYNGGEGNAKKMMVEYSNSADKAKFISEGQTSLKGIHKNIKVRMDNMAAADELLSPKITAKK